MERPFRCYTNASCVKCDIVEKDMVLVGAFVMCKKCIQKEFGDVIGYDTDSEKYKKLLQVWANKND